MTAGNNAGKFLFNVRPRSEGTERPVSLEVKSMCLKLGPFLDLPSTRDNGLKTYSGYSGGPVGKLYFGP